LSSWRRLCTTSWQPLEMQETLFAFTAGSVSGSALWTAPCSNDPAPIWQCRHSRLLMARAIGYLGERVLFVGSGHRDAAVRQVLPLSFLCRRARRGCVSFFAFISCRTGVLNTAHEELNIGNEPLSLVLPPIKKIIFNQLRRT
jgi:hypothetical protein